MSNRLKDLCDAGFIKEYTPWGKEYHSYYKVIDEFCLFYLYWIKKYEQHPFDPEYWIIQSQRPTYYAWAGYAFEAICIKHIHQITRALGIKTAIRIGSLKYTPHLPSENGAQIDLIIDRLDDALTICEIKYTDKPFKIDKKYAANLVNKVTLFKKHEKIEKQIFLSIVSANGIKKTFYSEELIKGFVTLNDLFKDSS